MDYKRKAKYNILIKLCIGMIRNLKEMIVLGTVYLYRTFSFVVLEEDSEPTSETASLDLDFFMSGTPATRPNTSVFTQETAKGFFICSFFCCCYVYLQRVQYMYIVYNILCFSLLLALLFSAFETCAFLFLILLLL